MNRNECYQIKNNTYLQNYISKRGKEIARKYIIFNQNEFYRLLLSTSINKGIRFTKGSCLFCLHKLLIFQRQNQDRLLIWHILWDLEDACGLVIAKFPVRICFFLENKIMRIYLTYTLRSFQFSLGKCIGIFLSFMESIKREVESITSPSQCIGKIDFDGAYTAYNSIRSKNLCEYCKF